MTREEILALEPGPKLDALVAERVMGWERVAFNHETSDQRYDTTVWRKCVIHGKLEYCEYRPPSRGWGIWHPSTDMNHALEVAEKMWGSSGSGSIEVRIYWDEGETSVVVNGYGPGVHLRLTEKLPLAICRACLIADLDRLDDIIHEAEGEPQ